MKYILILLVLLTSCTQVQPEEQKLTKFYELADLLNDCKGLTIVVAKGFNEANFKGRQHYLLIKDSTNSYYDYVGGKYEINVGDTLK
jgi:hypothetical protein